MPKSAFAVGASVRVKPGTPSDYPDFPLGGWTGTIVEIQQDDTSPHCLVKFDVRTLAQVNPIYHKRCVRDGYLATHFNFREEDLEPGTGEPTVIEQPAQIQSDHTDDYDGVRWRLGLTPDDVVGGQVESRLFEDYFRVITRAKTQEVLLRMYPALADWVENHGTIEIGRSGEACVARLHSGPRVVFEDAKPRTLADALRALETAFQCDISQLPAPVVLDRSWLTPTVVVLAEQIDRSGDFSALPILADGLQDAGCADPTVLDHCRGPATHARNCWVVDLVLGKK